MANRIYTLAERPDLRKQVSDINAVVWPKFMGEDDVGNRVWPYLFTEWPGFQVAICDAEDRVTAAGNSVPFAWDGNPETLPEGWEAAAEQGLHDLEAGRITNALTAYAIVVAPGQQRQGLSAQVLEAMREAGKAGGMHSLVACVRPTLKALYPLIPIEHYAQWKRADGAPFDPWIRVHWRAGAEQLQVSPRSMTITGSVAQWQEWTGLDFPESGQYVVAGALEPVSISVEEDLGTYHDPNVWMRHRLA